MRMTNKRSMTVTFFAFIAAIMASYSATAEGGKATSDRAGQ